jgi:hypothetical protein
MLVAMMWGTYRARILVMIPAVTKYQFLPYGHALANRWTVNYRYCRKLTIPPLRDFEAWFSKVCDLLSYFYSRLLL